jgi:predicted metal-dependent phosphoesterase TrpH
MNGYYMMANEGLKCGVRVLLGMEITFLEGPEDYLVYGIDEEFLKENPELYKKNIKSFSKIAKKNSLFVAQAHPFREYIKNISVKYIDGIEVYNGTKKHNSHNDKALAFAENNKMIKIAGSDFHYLEDLARAGVIMNNLADSSEELAQLLFSKDITEILEGND